MAEGMINHFLGDRIEAFSAGTEATFVNPRAVAVLNEIGIDISHHRSKVIDLFSGQAFDFVVTLCGDANEKCPLYFGGVERTHIDFTDPAQAIGSEEEIMEEFRQVRDQMKTVLLEHLKKE